MAKLLRKSLLTILLIGGFSQAMAMPAFILMSSNNQKSAYQKEIEAKEALKIDRTISNNMSYLIFLNKLETARHVYAHVHDPQLSINFWKLVDANLLVIDPSSPPVILKDMIRKDRMEITIDKEVAFSLINVDQSQCNIITNTFKQKEYLTSFKINDIETRSKNSEKVPECKEKNTLFWK